MYEGVPFSATVKTAAANAQDPAAQELWQACLTQLAQQLPEQQFNTWIKPLKVEVAPDLSRVTLFVANRFKLDGVRAQYGAQIAAALQAAVGEPVQLELALAPRRATPRVVAEHAPRAPAQPLAGEMAFEEPEVMPAPTPAPHSRLNPALTFATLVEGTANRMARSAAMHVAAQPGQMYNPLFIYGGVGLARPI